MGSYEERKGELEFQIKMPGGDLRSERTLSSSQHASTKGPGRGQHGLIGATGLWVLIPRFGGERLRTVRSAGRTYAHHHRYRHHP